MTGQTVFLLGQIANQKFALVAIAHGQLVPVATGLPSMGLTVTSGAFPVVAGLVLDGSQDPITNVWTLGAGGPVQIASLADAQVSTVGGTTHVIGLAPGTNGFFNVVLVRYRDGQAPQDLVLQTQVPNTHPSVVTTPEGAAIASGYNASWAVPSTAMTATALTPGSIVGGARGNATVFVGEQSSNLQRQLFAYDENGGTPRVTALTTLDDTTDLVMLDPPEGAPSTWFAYKSGGACHIAQLVYTGTTPSLAHEVPCGDTQGIAAWGRTSDGQLAVLVPGSNRAALVYKLGDDAATNVVTSTVQDAYLDLGPVVDTSGYPAVVVGWWGVDAMGGFACLARHPERCWAVPPSSTYSPPAVMAARASSDDTDELGLLWYPGATGSDAVFLHAVGNGDRPAPL